MVDPPGPSRSVLGRSTGRPWGVLVSASGEVRDRLWGASHGRRQFPPATHLRLDRVTGRPRYRLRHDR